MIPYYYYIDAKRRLRESNITIDMMGGEDECQPMIVAQRDMLELEVDYYHTESIKFTIKTIAFTVLAGVLYLYLRG